MSQKVIICDMDGTLIREEVTYNGEILPSRWNQIMHYLGDDARRREKEAKQDWYDGLYKEHPVDFLNDIINIFYDEGLKKDYFEKVIDSYELFPGVKDVFSELNKLGNYTTALISGGFMALAENVSNELGIDYTRAACKLEWDYQGNLAGWNLLREDYGSKVTSLEEIIAECGAELSNCVYVGNGKNDVSVAKYIVENGGTAVAFNGPPELKEVCTYSVDGENFYEVLEYIR